MTEYLFSPSVLSQWLPVVGTLLGATIGFVGGLFNSWFTQRSQDNAERDGRERERIEKLYETLIEIRMIYQRMHTDMIAKVHFGQEPSMVETSGIPPLVKLDMVIHMYYPKLTDAHKSFLAIKERFGAKYANNLISSFSSEDPEVKKKICSEYMELYSELSHEISNLQRLLASMVKA